MFLNKDKTEEKRCVLRLFGARAEAVELAAAKLRGVKAQCASRGGETLVALQAEKQSKLRKAEKCLRSRFANDLYGRGDETLAETLVSELEKRGRMFVCADAESGALAEGRLEAIEGAERVFDFGRLSYGHPELCAKIKTQVRGRAGGKSSEQQALARLKAVLRLSGAELAAACAKQGSGFLLLVGTRRGCWVRLVDKAENPGLWLLDMLRRAAAGLKQAEGTCHQSYHGRLRLPKSEPQPAGVKAEAPPIAVQTAAAAVPVRRSGHALPRLLTALLLLALLALALVWYYTGGDLTAFPEQLGFNTLPSPGASLV